MAENSQNIKYVKLDDGVSFSLVRTNPKLTTNTKLMYNGKKMYMESYASSELMNRAKYKNVSIKQNSTYNKDIARFLTGSGSQAYNVYQNFSNVAISDSYDNQYETLYWCGAEYIDSSFYSEDIGFVAPLYLREKLPNYFLIFRIDTPSNYNFNKGDYDKDGDSEYNDPIFDFKTDILDKAVLLKTFDLREGSVLGNYIHNYIDQDAFEFDKSMYVNFSNAEVTYYGINKNSGVLEKKVENFENELLKNDNPVFVNDKWFTEGFERNGLIFPYIMNIEYLFDDDTFKQNGSESFDFARYIGVYCNNIEFGEFGDFSELEDTKDDVIYYFEDNQRNLHRYVKDDSGLTIDGKPKSNFDKNLISGFEKERITAYAEPLDIYEGFINRTRYEFEILKPFEPGDWIGISYDNNVEYYYADDKNFVDGKYSDFRFYVGENSSLNDIAESFVKCVNHNKNGICEVKCSGNSVVLYVKEGMEIDEENMKIHIDSTLIYNKKIATFNNNEYVYKNGYYEDSFCKTFNVYIDKITETYKNVFKIYANDYILFSLDRYLKTNNDNGRKISANMIYINAEGDIEPEYRIVVVENVNGKENSIGYNISVSSTYQVEIIDKFKPNYGVLSWFPVKDFDFDINYSSYGKYDAFIDECNILSEKIKSKITIEDPNEKYDSIEIDNPIDHEKIKKLAKSHFVDDYNNPLESEYEYYYEQYHTDLCLISKSVPYVSKWGYYDEQKDSCENPYRLNVSKVFGVSNLSANINSIKCDEKEYTHNMPYYMTFDEELDYSKNYQYIESDEYYKNKYVGKTDEGDSGINGTMDDTKTFDGCVNYWIDKFKKTDEDMFSHFFSGKKYGKRFDRKYSRLLGGDKFHNPSTLFRGVKFEVIRQYNGVEKRSSEYNNYRFSFIYIPVMNESLVFKNTVYFVKNDTFKFIVGIILVNTMLGKYNHNIFNKKIDYFNKGFVYAACKDLIRPINTDGFEYQFVFSDNEIANVSMFNDFCKVYKNGNFYMWEDKDPNKIIENRVFITATNEFKDENDIIGAFNVVNGNKKTSIENIQTYEKYKETYKENCIDNIKFNLNESEQLKLSCVRRYEEYDV